ncbi:MAG: Ribosomal RNA small subunit methyltransferase G [Pelotomaculum thermopropionicum]|uniref:Ribosomal RNA small subunit methyltransferase G n=1 Tax=Pelotomaculum thermopropionicum TaxID=110500 RepID=A0A101HRK8_9FIRM|nr:MAG: Ribosomal RNA small subunit methyltransferase G [Pelotomaculum thermopropionicum]
MSVLAATLRTGCREMGIELTGTQIKLFEMHFRLLAAANKKFNLTGIVTEKEAAVKHYLDALTCLKVINNGTKAKRISLIDIGTGAGLPGVPIKICRPEINITLVEAQKKKALFLEGIKNSLALDGLKVVCARAEDIGRDQDYREKYDWAVARAVSGLKIIAEYGLPVVRTGGHFLAMKGPRAETEIIKAVGAVNLLGGAIKESIRVKLPFTGETRNLVLIKKVGPTPEKYPRRAGIPQKRPLE